MQTVAVEVWNIPSDWQPILREFTDSEDYHQLQRRIAEQRSNHVVFPPAADVMNAFRFTPWDRLRVVILGQDPYHGPGQAHGLSFSVPEGMPFPPTLRNIFREWSDDLGFSPPASGCLEAWAREGVLLLNAALTVRAGQANSHQTIGWRRFTEFVLAQISELKPYCVFVLWGQFAGQLADRIDQRHGILTSPHPSPLSAHRGFFGSRVFSRCNRCLQAHGLAPIDWRLPSRP